MIASVCAYLSTLLWGASWQGAAAVAIAATACLIGRPYLSANARCWLWRIALLRFAVALAIPSGLGVLVPSPVPVPSAPVAVIDAWTKPPVTPAVPGPAVAARSIGQNWSAETARPSSAPAVTPADAETGHADEPSRTALPILALMYAAVVAAGMCRLVRTVWRTHTIFRNASDATGEAAVALDDITARLELRRAPRLAVSADVDFPMYAASTVVLPAGAAFTSGELQLVLAHEAAHARRRDLIWEAVGAAIAVVFWFHPLVYLARREERLARESAADNLALRATAAAPADYGRLPLSVTAAPRRDRFPTLLAAGVFEPGATLLRRRLASLGDGRTRRSPTARAAGLILAVLSAVGAMAPLRIATAAPFHAGQRGGIEADMAGRGGTLTLVEGVRCVFMTPDGDTMIVAADSRGIVALPNFVAATFHAEKDGRMLRGSYRWQEDGSLRVTANGRSDVYRDGTAAGLTFPEGVSAPVTGRVEDPNAQPIAHAEIVVRENDPVTHRELTPRTFPADSAGRFRFRLALGGEYNLYAERYDFERSRTQHGHGVALASAGGSSDLGTIVLAPATGALVGRVVDEDAKGVPNMAVYEAAGQSFSAIMLTGPDGTFRFNALDPHPAYVVDVYRPEKRGSRYFLTERTDVENGWHRTGVHAGTTPLVITLRRSQVGLALDASAK